MRKLAAIAGLAFVFSLQANSQTDLPKFAVDVRESFVWGEDATAGAESSAIKDPLSSAELRKLKHNGVEVSSRIGFEKPHPEDVGEFIVYSLTIVNSTKTELAVETGGIVVDGHFVAPLPVDYSSRGSKRKHSSVVGKEVVDIRNLNCFASGYLSSEKFL